MRLLITSAALAMLAVGCSAHSQQVKPDPAPPADAGISARLSEACDGCHTATTYTSKRLDAAKWGEVVDQMIDKGAAINDADYTAFVRYLARHYGPDTKP